MLTFLIFVVVAAAAVHVASIGLALGRHLVRRRGRRRTGAAPFVSLLRPVCGVDTFDRETLGASFAQDYLDYEVIFCAASEDDPAVRLTRDLIAAHPDVDARVLIGDDHPTANPKLNNLDKGVRAAKGDILVMTDSNLMLPPDYLATLDEAWKPGVGLVSAPAYGDRAENFWGAVEGAFLNSHQGRWQLAADAVGLGFAQGKTLGWRRDVLEAGGGLRALGRNLAEDVASTRLVRDQGLNVRLPARLFAQPIGRKSARAVWDRQLRWNRIRRDGFPGLFALEIVLGPVLPIAALGGLVAQGTAPLWMLPALTVGWYGAEVALLAGLGWPATARDIAALVMRDLMMPVLWVTTFRARGFTWRGTDMASQEAEA